MGRIFTILCLSFYPKTRFGSWKLEIAGLIGTVFYKRSWCLYEYSAQLWKQPLTFKPHPAPSEHNHLLGDIKLTSAELLSFHRPMKVFIWHLQSMVSSPAVYFPMVQELKIMSSYTVKLHKHFWFSSFLTGDNNFLFIILYVGKIHALYVCICVWGRVIELCNSL